MAMRFSYEQFRQAWSDMFWEDPDVIELIAGAPVRHRLVLSYDALADDIPADQIVDRVLGAVPLPTVAPRQNAVPTGASNSGPAGAQQAASWPRRPA